MRTTNMMYNQEQKQEYLDFENTNRIAMERYFKRIAPKERSYNKDIAEMDAEELRETLASLKMRTKDTRGHFVSMLRWYIKWAVLNGKAKSSDAIDAISPDSVDAQDVIQNKMIKNPEQLRTMLKNSLDYEFYANRSVRDELIVWLLYYGLPLEKMRYLKKTDVDYENKKVIADGKEYDVDEKILELWSKLSNISYIEKKNGRDLGTQEYMKYILIDNDYLFRPIAGKKIGNNYLLSLSVFRGVLLNLFQGIPARNLNQSGKFYRLYLLESGGVEITNEVIAEHYDITYETKTELYLKTRKIRIDYEDWKVAFELV